LFFLSSFAFLLLFWLLEWQHGTAIISNLDCIYMWAGLLLDTRMTHHWWWHDDNTPHLFSTSCITPTPSKKLAPMTKLSS
jgi:hypothetical protein